MQKLFFGETVDGWGVIRDQPWAFGGVYASREAARQAAAKLGPGFAVRYGQNRIGTCGFRLCPEPTSDVSQNPHDVRADRDTSDSTRSPLEV